MERDKERERERANKAFRIELKITRVKIVKPTRDEGFRFSLLFLRKIESDLEIAIAVIFQLHTCIIFDFAKGKTTLFGICILLLRRRRCLNTIGTRVFILKS